MGASPVYYPLWGLSISIITSLMPANSPVIAKKIIPLIYGLLAVIGFWFCKRLQVFACDKSKSYSTWEGNFSWTFGVWRNDVNFSFKGEEFWSSHNSICLRKEKQRKKATLAPENTVKNSSKFFAHKFPSKNKSTVWHSTSSLFSDNVLLPGEKKFLANLEGAWDFEWSTSIPSLAFHD